jgi:F0F1-type ATP synthase membrane subunit c/vacuolar-type H+-ATPase subunit K
LAIASSDEKAFLPSFLALITSAKVISYAVSVGAFGSCTIAVSSVFAAFLQAASHLPGRQDGLWAFTLIGVALVETFFFVTILIIVLIFARLRVFFPSFYTVALPCTGFLVSFQANNHHPLT